MRYLLFLPILFIHVSAYGSEIDSRVAKWPTMGSSYAKATADRRLALLRHENHYALSDGMYEKAIRPELISKPLRSMDASKLAALLETGKAYVKIDQCDDGELTMDLMPRCPGGGFGGALGGLAFGEVVGKIVPLACGYIILYGTKGVIRVTAGKEASDAFDEHIVQVSIPHLHEVTETIAHYAGFVGGAAGGVMFPG